mgnify:CR=1 FL=1
MKTTQRIIISSMLASLVCVATMIIKLPSPLGGYINLGDCIVLLCGWILNPVYAFFAAAIGSALAACAGFFMVLKSPPVNSTLGAMPGIKAFTAAVIGGIGSIPGAMLGGILLGMIGSISYKITAIAPYTDAIEFSILILILLVRPTGFLGKKRREKV